MDFSNTSKLFFQLKEELYLTRYDIKLVWVAQRHCYCKELDIYFDALCERLPDDEGFKIELNTNLSTPGNLNSVKSFRFYEVLAHEMKHVKQFVSGQLEIPSSKVFFWEGKRHYYSQVEYNKQPHEIDAKCFGLDWALKNHPVYSKKKWKVKDML